MRVAVSAARRRTSAGSSEVATTTTERARPSGPRSFSRNSRTSRPRSPTRAMTETSASLLRATIDSRLDLPTPEPAKMPRRCPRPTGTRVSSARTPRASGVSTRARRSGCGGVPDTPAWGRPTRLGPPSTGRPRPSRTRPSRASPRPTVSGPPVARTGAPVRTPCIVPKGMQTRPSSRRATTSAASDLPSTSTSTASPMAASRPSTSRSRPTTRRMRPVTSGAAARRAASSCSVIGGPPRRG
jgi:hypothetical protein